MLLPEPEALPELARVRRRRGVARQAGLPPPIAWKRQDGHTSDHDRNLAEAAVDPTEMAARSRQAQGALRFFATQSTNQLGWPRFVNPVGKVRLRRHRPHDDPGRI